MVQKNFFSRKGFSDAGTGMMRGSSRTWASQYARRSAAAWETFILSIQASIFSCSTAFLAWEMLVVLLLDMTSFILLPLLRGGTVMGLAGDRLDAAALADGRQRSGWFWAPALRLTRAGRGPRAPLTRGLCLQGGACGGRSGRTASLLTRRGAGGTGSGSASCSRGKALSGWR